MTRPCAFRDCGDPDCRLCALARQKVERFLDEGKRAAVAVPQARKATSPSFPKKRHREGPHR